MKTYLFDRSVWLFFFALLLLGGLFAYLFKIDKRITLYDTNRHRVEKMIIYDYQINDILNKPYNYIDYDKSNKLENAFESELQALGDNALTSKYQHKLKEIERYFKQKEVLFEDFKTLNARVTNAIRLLYDFRKNFVKHFFDDEEKRLLMGNLFLPISQMMMNLPYDRVHLQENMERLQAYGKKSEMLQFFHAHLQQFLKDDRRIKQIQSQWNEIPLLDALESLLVSMKASYVKDRGEQIFIAVLFFVFLLILLLLLFVSYIKSRKVTGELQAFRSAIENSDNSIVITDVNRHIQYANEAFEKYTGYKVEEVLGKNPNVLKSGLMDEDFYREMNETLDHGQKWHGEIINRRKDGSLLYEKASIVPIFIDGKLEKYLAVKLDITTYKERQKQLDQAAAVYEALTDGVVITDADKVIIEVNPAMEKMFGYTKEELMGKDISLIPIKGENGVPIELPWQEIEQKEQWSGKIYKQTKSGEVLPVWLTVSVVRNGKGQIQNYIGIDTNLNEIMQMQKKVEFLAYHDSLTNLPNRVYFERHIKDVLERGRHKGIEIAILFIDLDRFKVINDTLGHSVGDKMLMELASRISKLLNNKHLFARIGGDEFVIAMELEDGREDASRMASAILRVVGEPIWIKDYYLNTTASIGITLFPEDAKDAHTLIRYADSAMYAAKEKGKDTFQFYTKVLSEQVEERLHIEQELLYALERDELSLYFQPQFDLESNKILGVEALLRWHNATLGNVSPDRFISIAEETGMIVKIGEWVFEEACRTYMEWSNAGLEIGSISINVSTVQFRDEEILDRLKLIMENIGIAPEHVELEITERFIMEHSTSNLTVLESLRDLGCKISVDDFGTGYSSLSYMKQLPLDTIKIDRSFVSELPENSHDVEVTRAIIALSKSLGYQVIAEGVETAQQAVFLKEQHCDMAQGYFFARPMDKETFMQYLKEKHNKNKGSL
jgi:diguanylate cyclase (GGDEF)-like protein/PAS domain S-box-containing protein